METTELIEAVILAAVVVTIHAVGLYSAYRLGRSRGWLAGVDAMLTTQTKEILSRVDK